MNDPLEVGARDASQVTGGDGRRRLDANLRLLDVGEIPLGLDDGPANGFDGGCAEARCGGTRPTGSGEIGQHHLDEQTIDVVAAEMCVPVGRQDLEYTVLDLQYRNVERAAAKVVHRDRPAIALVQPVGERGGSRLVDDAQHLEAGEASRVARGRALRVVEVRRHGDDRAIDLEVELTLLAEMLLGAMLQLAKHECRDFRRRELTIGHADPEDAAGLAGDAERQQRGIPAHIVDAAPHESLDGVDRPRGRRQQPPLRLAADENRRVLAQRDNGRHQRVATLVPYDDRPVAVHVGDQAVGRPEIDADDLTHDRPWPAARRRPGSRPRVRWLRAGC